MQLRSLNFWLSILSLFHALLNASVCSLALLLIAAEIIKRRVPDIHQTTEISSITIVDVWEPKVCGLTV